MARYAAIPSTSSARHPSRVFFRVLAWGLGQDPSPDPQNAQELELRVALSCRLIDKPSFKVLNEESSTLVPSKRAVLERRASERDGERERERDRERERERENEKESYLGCRNRLGFRGVIKGHTFQTMLISSCSPRSLCLSCLQYPVSFKLGKEVLLVPDESGMKRSGGRFLGHSLCGTLP